VLVDVFALLSDKDCELEFSFELTSGVEGSVVDIDKVVVGVEVDVVVYVLVV